MTRWKERNGALTSFVAFKLLVEGVRPKNLLRSRREEGHGEIRKPVLEAFVHVLTRVFTIYILFSAVLLVFVQGTNTVIEIALLTCLLSEQHLVTGCHWEDRQVEIIHRS